MLSSKALELPPIFLLRLNVRPNRQEQLCARHSPHDHIEKRLSPTAKRKIPALIFSTVNTGPTESLERLHPRYVLPKLHTRGYLSPLRDLRKLLITACQIKTLSQGGDKTVVFTHLKQVHQVSDSYNNIIHSVLLSVVNAPLMYQSDCFGAFKFNKFSLLRAGLRSLTSPLQNDFQPVS